MYVDAIAPDFVRIKVLDVRLENRYGWTSKSALSVGSRCRGEVGGMLRNSRHQRILGIDGVRLSWCEMRKLINHKSCDLNWSRSIGCKIRAFVFVISKYHRPPNEFSLFEEQNRVFLYEIPIVARSEIEIRRPIA